MIAQLRFRRNTSAQWTAHNPILDPGEPGYEIDTGKYKIGNGNSRWSALPYYLSEKAVLAAIDEAVQNLDPIGSEVEEVLDEHVNSETPHPVYDDGPSLVLLYQNAKV